MLFLYIQFIHELIIVLLLWFLLSKHGRRQFRSLRKSVKHYWQRQKEHIARQWHPKSPNDCPHCCAGLKLQVARINHDVVPWSQRKGKGGAKKQFDTGGFACLNPVCLYFGITDPLIHALVKNTNRGKDKDIPQLKCQCCKKRFSSRKGTPLYHLKKKSQDVEMVLWFMAEGVDISVMVRYTGFADSTIARWLTRAGEHSTRLHDILFRGLVIPLVQIDELHARVRHSARRRWLWIAIDPISKALPTIHLGGRKAEDSYATLHDFTQRLAPGCIPAFTTDGLRAYFSAITAHMGEWVEKQRARKLHWKPHDQLLYGQLVKRREKRKITYTLTRMRWGKRSDLYTILENHGFSKNIHTAFIERVNLTIRQGISLLTRKTWSLPQSDQQLLLHVQWWRAYYHFIRAHESLREPIPGFKRKYNPRTPAMALGLTDQVWSVADFLTKPLPLLEAAA